MESGCPSRPVSAVQSGLKGFVAQYWWWPIRADARSLDDYTIREWVDFDGATYVEHEGEAEPLPGIRLLPAPGHTDGHQVVVVETGAGTNVLGGDVAVGFGELGSGTTEGQRRVLALGAPTWLSHAPGPKIPSLGRPWAW